MKPALYFTLLNHWSYTGIGWSLGLESCAESIGDSLKMADYTPSVRTGLNLDALAYEMVGERYPHLIRRLRTYLDAGRVEIVGGTFGQPMGSMVSGESNLRQLIVGQQTIQQTLGRRVAVFLEEEEMSHPQLPQMLAACGYRYASLAQCDTWGRHGAPRIDEPVALWQGVDGTTIVTAPLTPLVFHPPSVTQDIDWLWTDDGRSTLARIGQRTTPLVLKWTEFGWETLSGRAINKFDPTLFRTLSEKFAVEYVTIEQYLERHTAGQISQAVGPDLPSLHLAMDDFAKLLPWGIGGDQLRRFGREVEATLLAAERFELVAHLLGLGVDHTETLHLAWRNLLAAQSHDVSLCEYSRHQGALPPAQPLIPTHGQTWGAIGYGLMDDALTGARSVLDDSLAAIARNIRAPSPAIPAAIPIVAFNACAFSRDTLVTTGLLQLSALAAAEIVVMDATGRPVPSQILTSDRAVDGQLDCAELAFFAHALPSVGYATFYVAPASPAQQTVTPLLRVDHSALTLENAHVRVALDPVSGAIRQLLDRRTGRLLLDSSARPFPTLTGRPHGAARPGHPAGKHEHCYDSSKTQAEFTWLENGPLHARVRATHPNTDGVGFEITVSLAANTPDVDVHVRLFPELPPHAGHGTINGWQFPLEIAEGYWLEFAPAFAVERVLRDYPFGVEECRKSAVDALTWLDLLANDGSGLHIVHSGTQYFKRHPDGTFANLAVREWESHYTGEFGWPRLCRYHYRLRPHGADFTNLDRTHAAASFDSPPFVATAPAASAGPLPRTQSFVSIESDGAYVASLRRPLHAPASAEIRLVECAGRATSARVNTSLPLRVVQLTDALGQPLASAAPGLASSPVALRPWQFQTLQLSH